MIILLIKNYIFQQFDLIPMKFCRFEFEKGNKIRFDIKNPSFAHFYVAGKD